MSERKRKLSLGVGVLALWALGGCGGGVSGEVGRACMASGRSAANPALCSCIQGAANGTLTQGEQNRAAALFESPDRAQATRASNARADEVFWSHYRAFADRAEALCD